MIARASGHIQWNLCHLTWNILSEQVKKANRKINWQSLGVCPRLFVFRWCNNTAGITLLLLLPNTHSVPTDFLIFIIYMYNCTSTLQLKTNLNALHLVPTVSMSQLLRSGSLSFILSKCVLALTFSVIILRTHISSRPSNLLAPSSCTSDSASDDHCSRLQIIFTYLFTY